MWMPPALLLLPLQTTNVLFVNFSIILISENRTFHYNLELRNQTTPTDDSIIVDIMSHELIYEDLSRFNTTIKCSKLKSSVCFVLITKETSVSVCLCFCTKLNLFYFILAHTDTIVSLQQGRSSTLHDCHLRQRYRCGQKHSKSNC